MSGQETVDAAQRIINSGQTTVNAQLVVQLLDYIDALEAAHADARRTALLDAASAVDVDGSEVDYEETNEPAGRRHAADQILGMAERHEPLLTKYRQRLIHEIADHAQDVINNGNVAEIAAPSGVPETGRGSAVDARDDLHEDPVAWLRAYADTAEPPTTETEGGGE